MQTYLFMQTDRNTIKHNSFFTAQK